LTGFKKRKESGMFFPGVHHKGMAWKPFLGGGESRAG